MADPFAAALGALFRAPGTAAAVFTPKGGVPRAIRVVRSQPSENAGDGDRRYVTDTNAFDIRRVDVAQPAPGDALTVDGEAFKLAGAPILDVEGMTWTCPAVPA